MYGEKKSKLTKTEFVKQVKESRSYDTSLNTNAYDLNENGGFQKSKSQSCGENFLRSIKL